MTTIQELLNKMWIDYCNLNPSARRIFELFTQEGENVINDHIALRTFQHPKLGIESLAKIFKKFGYLEKQTYLFEEKKLFAKHYEHPNLELPKIFISELEIIKTSSFVQREVEKMAEHITDQVAQNPTFSMIGRPWPMSYEVYAKLAAESEYASWVSAFGFRPNHFTINVNALKKYTSISAVNSFLKEKGYVLNNSGGEIKGTPDDLLEQSSTMSEKVQVSFSDGVHLIPGCYYEFAKRYPDSNGRLYTGFVAKSADKIFESTNSRPRT